MLHSCTRLRDRVYRIEHRAALKILSPPRVWLYTVNSRCHIRYLRYCEREGSWTIRSSLRINRREARQTLDPPKRASVCHSFFIYSPSLNPGSLFRHC
jgi:hypothetical protein